MEMHEIEQEFNKVWNRSDYKQKKMLLREIDRIVNRKESENKRIKAFFQAVQNNKVGAVNNVLDQGIDVNVKDEVLGNTALCHAVFAGNVEMIKILLDQGADPRVQNNRGYNAIDAGKLMGNDEINKLINLNQ